MNIHISMKIVFILIILITKTDIKRKKKQTITKGKTFSS